MGREQDKSAKSDGKEERKETRNREKKGTTRTVNGATLSDIGMAARDSPSIALIQPFV